MFTGTIVAYYFGDEINQSANLNWVGYHAGTGHRSATDGVWEGKAWWVNLIAFYVIVFPATDVISAFPLNGITLGNNLMSQVYPSKSRGRGEDRDREEDKKTVTLFRLMGCIPPIIGACFVRDLGKITDYTGITG
tara:strand:+ start:415 stop:819 length:405 start_codon:yes stop_codon:yes gene_type:complete